jgi:hypothetical protein
MFLIILFYSHSFQLLREDDGLAAKITCQGLWRLTKSLTINNRPKVKEIKEVANAMYQIFGSDTIDLIEYCIKDEIDDTGKIYLRIK